MIGMIVGANGRIGRVVSGRLPKKKVITISATEILRLTDSEINALGVDLRRRSIKWIMNCAGYTEMNSSRINAGLSKRFNFEVVERLVRLCIVGQISLFQLSTDLCNLMEYPSHQLTLSDLYHHYKMRSELLIRGSGIDALIARFGWPYLMDESWIGQHITMGKIDDLTITNADDARYPTDIDDLSNLFHYLLNQTDFNGSTIINIGSPQIIYKGEYIYRLISKFEKYRSASIVCQSRRWGDVHNKTAPLPSNIRNITTFGSYVFENKIMDISLSC